MPVVLQQRRFDTRLQPVPDDAELEAVVASALDDGGVTHLHGGRVGTSQVLLVLDGLLHRLGQLAVTHFLQDRRGQQGGQPVMVVLGASQKSWCVTMRWRTNEKANY